MAAIKILWLIAAIREINEACLPATHFPFDSKHTRESNGRSGQRRKKEEMFEGNVYIDIVEIVLPFAGFPRRVANQN